MSNQGRQRAVVIYCRYSSDMQRSGSCDFQERAVRDEFSRLGIDHSHARVLKDEAISGATEDRPGFQDVIGMVHNGQISVLGVYDLSRLSRGSNVMAFIEDLDFNGTRLISVGDHVDTNTDDWELPVTLA